MRKSNNMDSSNSTMAGIVLSGGQGSRMGGVDKGLLNYQGRRLIEYVVERICKQTNELVISANRNIEHYQDLGHQVIQDANRESYEGPMAGICEVFTKLDSGAHDYALISSCDTPKIPLFLAERLMVGLSQSNAQVALVNDGQRRQNLHCLIKRSAWQSLIEYYQQGGRTMHHWQKLIGDIEVDFSDCVSAFDNFNRQRNVDYT